NAELSGIRGSDLDHPAPSLAAMLNAGRVFVNGAFSGDTYWGESGDSPGIFIALHPTLFLASSTFMTFVMAHEAWHNQNFFSDAEGMADLYACRYVYVSSECSHLLSFGLSL